MNEVKNGAVCRCGAVYRVWGSLRYWTFEGGTSTGHMHLPLEVAS